MGIRILHLADSHIGADLPRRRRHERPRRGDDLITSYQRVLQFAYDYRVDAVIHAGDIFDSPKPTTDAIWAATQPLRALADEGIPVILVPGNHERSVLPAALLLHHPLIHVLAQPRTIRLHTASGRLAVAGFPYLRRPTSDTFVAAIEATGWRAVDADARVLVTHQAFDSAVCGPQHYRFRLGTDDVVARRTVPTEFDYVAAGHIHRQQRLKPVRRLRPEIVYAGAPDRITFAETDEPKGAMIVEFDGGPPQHRFVEHRVRPMSVHPLAVSGWSRTQLLEVIEATVMALPKNAVAQLRLTGVADPEALSRINLPARAFGWREDVICSYTIRGIEWEANAKTKPAVSEKTSTPDATNEIASSTITDVTALALQLATLKNVNKRASSVASIHATPATARRLPTTCGVYLFYDDDARLIYVGKAVNLRARVKSHFSTQRSGNYFANWTGHVKHIRALQLATEADALDVESSLIEQLRPPFNIAGRIPPISQNS